MKSVYKSKNNIVLSLKEKSSAFPCTRKFLISGAGGSPSMSWTSILSAAWKHLRTEIPHLINQNLLRMEPNSPHISMFLKWKELKQERRCLRQGCPQQTIHIPVKERTPPVREEMNLSTVSGANVMKTEQSQRLLYRILKNPRYTICCWHLTRLNSKGIPISLETLHKEKA